MKPRFYNMDCVEGCRQHLDDECVDLIITDPPYGIEGDALHKHYNRNEGYVVDGYHEVSRSDYERFSREWIAQAERILRPGGAIYIVSGYTHLREILNALHQTRLQEVNHLIWKYNFGVYTKSKYVSSHYHMLFWVKPGKRPTFNTYARYGANERDAHGGSLNYLDREDVWIINREYKPGRLKNKNELPHALLQKILQYSSHENDVVCDLFLGSFATAKVAWGLNRNVCGFEISTPIFDYHLQEFQRLDKGYLIREIRTPAPNQQSRQGVRWTREELAGLESRYQALKAQGLTKKAAIAQLVSEMSRGRFAILNALKRLGY